MFWFGAIVSLCYLPGITGAYIATQWPVLAITLWFGLLRNGPFTWMHAAMLIFIAYATVHAWYTPMPYSSIFGLWLVWIFGLCFWFGTTLQPWYARELYKGLAIGGVVSSVVAVLQYCGLQIFPETSLGFAGIYVNRVQQGTVLALLLVLLVSQRMWWLAFLLVPGAVLSQSRSALLVICVGLLACLTQRVWIFTLIGLAGVCYLFASSAPSDIERILIWRHAWQGLTWFGWGPGVFYGILIPRDGTFFYPEYAHNDILQLLFEYGVGAVAIFVVFGFALSRTDAEEWPVVVAFVAAGCVSPALWMPVAAFVVFVAMGRIVRADAWTRGYGDRGGSDVLSWQSRAGTEGSEIVSLEPSYCGKG